MTGEGEESVEASVHFCLETDEVTDITTDLTLSPELESIQLTPAQMLPKATFSFGGVLTKVAGVVVHAPRTSALRGVTVARQQPQVAF